jgi:hypothetical protein
VLPHVPDLGVKDVGLGASMADQPEGRHGDLEGGQVHLPFQEKMYYQQAPSLCCLLSNATHLGPLKPPSFQATRFGVTNVDKLLKEIHTTAVQHALYIMHERRAKERETLANKDKHTSGNRANNTAQQPIGPQRTKAPPR